MGLSTLAGFLWMTGILLGFSRDHGWKQGRLSFLASVYQLPVWQWLLIFSLLGVVSALAFYLSFQVGVESSLRYQKKLFHKILAKQKNCEPLPDLKAEIPYSTEKNEAEPSKSPALLRLLKTNTHMAGQVNRRLARAFIPALTVIAGLVGLVYLEPGLTALLLPLFLIFVTGLYRINVHAAETSENLNRVFAESSRKIQQFINLCRQRPQLLENPDEFSQRLEKSDYPLLSRLKYQRRLLDIHVNWLKTFLLVLAILIMVWWFTVNNSRQPFDWSRLLLYLIILRFAASALGIVGSATVAFSRFYPEIKSLFDFLEGTGRQSFEVLSVGNGVPSEELEDMDEY